MKSSYYEIKNSYKILFLIFAVAIALQFGFKAQSEFFESLYVPHVLLIASPLAASVFSFVISKMYSGSKVFGRSYFALGIGFFCIFIAESIYVYFGDLHGLEVPVIADVLLFIGYPAMLTHLIINIRYFAEKIQTYQKIVVLSISSVIPLIFLVFALSNNFQLDDVYYDLIFVSSTTVTGAFTVVGFTLFRQSALFGAWILLLIGFIVGTAGDLSHRFLGIIETNWIESGLVLWMTSNFIIIYALYKHQKSI